MKIAMISLYLPSGSKIGVGYQAHYMANALVQRGHEVTMFSQYGRPDGSLYTSFQVAVGGRMRTFQFAWRLRNMDFSSFDVVHAHTDDYWLFGNCKTPHIRTMHGACLAEAFNIPRVNEKMRMLVLAATEILATKIADRTVAVSRNTIRFFPWVKQVIPNGVDLSQFFPSRKKEASPTILFVGTYLNRKRGKLLMEQFAKIVRPALPMAKLWMVCSDAPNAPGVTVTGNLPTARLAELYREAWIFCLPSSYEGFGVPYIEAMASGTAVVATPNVGAKEVLADGKYGLLVNPERLGEALLDLLKDGGERDRYRSAGLERANQYSWERVAGQYEEVYREVGKVRQ